MFKAPCAYTPVKARSRSSPKFSFGVKHAKDKFNITPGKNTIFRFKLFILLLAIIQTQISAPGHYQPEKANQDTAPKYSFGVKTVEKMQSHSPGKGLRLFSFY